MKVSYNNISINTKALSKTLNYLMSIVKKKSLNGFFYRVPLNDSLLLDEMDFSRQNIDYHIKNHLNELGIITIIFKGGKTITNKGKEIYKKNLYSINKDRFLIWYFFCEAANQLDQNKVKLDKNRYELNFELEPIIKSITNSMKIVPVGKLYFYSSNKDGRARELEEQYINSMIIHYYKSMYLNVVRTIGTRYNYLYLNPTTRFFVDSIEKEYTIVLDKLLETIYIDNTFINIYTSLSYLAPHISSINNVLYITAKKSITDISILDKQWFTNELITKKKELFDVQEIGKKVNEYKFISSEELVKQFYSVNLFTLKPILVFTSKLSQDSIEQLKLDYAVFICKYSCYFRKLNEFITALNEAGRSIKLKLNIEAIFHNNKGKSFYQMKVSCRQNNQLCLLKKATRKQIITDMEFGEKDNFDLHGAIFSVARLINKSEWSCEWDIKQDLSERKYVDENGTIIELTRDDLKPVLYRCFFTKGFDDTYKKYVKKSNSREVKRFEDDDSSIEENKLLSKKVFKQVFDACQEWTGGTMNLTSNIFVIESILELSVLLCHDITEGLENVYDCFYFSQYLNEQKIKSELDQNSKWLLKQIENWKEEGAFNFSILNQQFDSPWSC